MKYRVQFLVVTAPPGVPAEEPQYGVVTLLVDDQNTILSESTWPFADIDDATLFIREVDCLFKSPPSGMEAMLARIEKGYEPTKAETIAMADTWLSGRDGSVTKH